MATQIATQVADSKKGFESQVTQVGAGTSTAIVIPPGIELGISVTLVVSSGSGKVQFTTSARNAVLAESGVNWQDWPAGTVTATTSDFASPVSGLRISTTSGTQTLEVVAE